VHKLVILEEGAVFEGMHGKNDITVLVVARWQTNDTKLHL
jgi:hypothetical protein